MLQIGEISLFSTLSESGLKLLSGMIERWPVQAGATICRKGETGSRFFAIASGGVHVLLSSGKTSSRVLLGPGQVFGEMALLTGMPVSATVEAAQDTTLYVLSGQAFAHVIEALPELRQTIMETLAQRLRHRSSAVAQGLLRPVCCFLVTSNGSRRAELLARRLFRRIAQYSPGSFLVDARDAPDRDLEASERLEADRPAFFPDTTHAARPLRGEGGGTLSSEWVVEASADWGEALIERWRRWGTAEQLLLLVLTPATYAELNRLAEPDDAVLSVSDFDGPSGLDRLNALVHHADETPVYLGAGDFGLHQRRRWGFRIGDAELNEASSPGPSRDVCSRTAVVDRLARWVTRREVGVALSAGAARGFAHLGVLQVLEELGVPVDAVTGTSMGGIVSLAYAMTGNALAATEKVRDAIGGNRKIRDASLFPRASFFAGRRVRHAAEKAFGEHRIEELELPCAVVASDLVRGEKFVIDRGSAADAAVATAAIPGLFPPVAWEGRILVDGALVSRIPLDILDRSRCGLQIAVNVIPSREVREDQAATISNWLSQRFSRFLGFSKVVGSSWELLAWYHGAHDARGADILIEPDTGVYSGYDFDTFDEMIAAGRKAALEKAGSIETALSETLRPGVP